MPAPDAPPSRALVLFGATGDLARRMLWPALYHLDRDGFLPEDLQIFAAARDDLGQEGVQTLVGQSLEAQVSAALLEDAPRRRLAARLRPLRFDAADPKAFARLRDALGDRARGALHYCAVRPSLYGDLCAGLAAAGLSGPARGVALEKPIGLDLASSRAINDAVASAFAEEAVFRIDHYLGKEAVQNLLALRFGNILFEPLWSERSIEHVQITIAETVGVEGRFDYYDASGALRDMVQNHLLQLLCLIAMEPPASFEAESVRNEKIKVLRSLRPIAGVDVAARVVAGQYRAGVCGDRAVPAYAEEEGARASRTETFVAIRAEIDNWRWAGVPFFLRTGKRLAERRTEILVRFRPLPHNIFGQAAGISQNTLKIQLQPNETVDLEIFSKEPGLSGFKFKPVALDLSLTQTFKERRRIAYERLILDALSGDRTLFVRRDEVEAAWSWIDQIQRGLAERGDPPRPYAAGSWGPSASVALIERAGFSWAE